MPVYKVIKSGNIIEVYEYEGSVARKTFDDYMKSDKGGRHNEGKEDRKVEYKNSVNQKARNKLRRLISANFGRNDIFMTITFKENMQDIEKANYELKKFVQKLKRKQKDFIYCAVIEFQKRGAVHYHMICNLAVNIDFDNEPDVREKEREIAKTWGHGFIDLKNIEHLDNAGAYLVKYMSKSGYDERLDGKKRYFFLVPASNLKNWWG